MLKKLFITIVIIFLSNSTYAVVNCPVAKIRHIQVQKNSILFRLEGQNWHRLGKPGDPGVDAMYRALLAAQMTDKPVLVRYPDGYVCSASTYNTDAIMVRTFN